LSAKIKSVEAKEVFAERGVLGLEVTVTTDTGASGVSTPTAGVSTGAHEAQFVLDGGSRYGGLGQRRAAANINDIIGPAVIGIEVSKQREIDAVMLALDGTPNKARLGANAIVGVSLATLKAAAASAGLPLYQYIGGSNAHVLPIPIVGVGQGGRYRDPGTSRWLKPSFEYLAYGAASTVHAIEMCWEIREELGGILMARYGPSAMIYGGQVNLAGHLKDDRELLDAMTEAIARAGHEGKVGLYIDCAAGCYYEKDIDRYVGFFAEGERTRADMLTLYRSCIANYPILSLEDVLEEEDIEGHGLFTRELGIEIVGDDLFTTNIGRLRQGIAAGAGNSMVLKVTQVGTVTEALDAAEECVRNGYNVHPCGSRGDAVSIADFAVGLNAGQVRGVSHNRLLSIECELGRAAIWPGKAAFKGTNQPWLKERVHGRPEPR
jgi:enolase